MHAEGYARGANVARRNRRTIRLRGYDYTREGWYFITLCTQDQACLFGEVIDGRMRPNDAGAMILSIWTAIPRHYLGIDVDVFVVMPNHIHGIVVICRNDVDTRMDLDVGAAPRGRPASDQAQGQAPAQRHGQAQGYAQTPREGQARGPAPTMALGSVVQRFKTMTATHYIAGVRQSAWPVFRGRLWQRNYYEHIIRDEESLNRIRQYISHNPAQWTSDRENPTIQLR